MPYPLWLLMLQRDYRQLDEELNMAVEADFVEFDKQWWLVGWVG